MEAIASWDARCLANRRPDPLPRLDLFQQPLKLVYSVSNSLVHRSGVDGGHTPRRLMIEQGGNGGDGHACDTREPRPDRPPKVVNREVGQSGFASNCTPRLREVHEWRTAWTGKDR